MSHTNKNPFQTEHDSLYHRMVCEIHILPWEPSDQTVLVRPDYKSEFQGVLKTVGT